jgi:hypothetical protein
MSPEVERDFARRFVAWYSHSIKFEDSYTTIMCCHQCSVFICLSPVYAGPVLVVDVLALFVTLVHLPPV